MENPRRYITRDGSGNFFDPHRAIFPIFSQREKGTSELIGTGFFITELGHFVTARHVFFKKDGSNYKSGKKLIGSY